MHLHTHTHTHTNINTHTDLKSPLVGISLPVVPILPEQSLSFLVSSEHQVNNGLKGEKLKTKNHNAFLKTKLSPLLFNSKLYN